MTELRVAPWAKFGHQRLYVNTAAGARVGWVDVRTGAVTVELPELAEEFHAAIAEHQAAAERGEPDAATASARPGAAESLEGGARRLSAPATEVTALLPAPAAVAVPTHPEAPQPREASSPQPVEPALQEEPEWFDLAANRPGQSARAQAREERAAMKEESKVRTFLALVTDARTDERAWRVGADGEETVGSRLERLGDRGWRVLHAIPVGRNGSDIDHLLIGPGGVFTVNTKNHPGGKMWVGRNAIRVNGFGVPYLRNSRFEADRAGRLLSSAVGEPVAVRAVLVFLTGTLIPAVTIKEAPADVLVLDRTDVRRTFLRTPQQLTSDQVERIFAAARRSSTWVPNDARAVPAAP